MVSKIGQIWEEKALQAEKKSGESGFISGSLIGVANGLFGGGGGMIAVPLLQRTGLQSKEAHATAILVILPISAISFLVYAWRGFATANVLIPTALGVTAGGFLGAKLLGNMTGKAVRIAFAFLQLFAGLFMLFSR